MIVDDRNDLLALLVFVPRIANAIPVWSKNSCGFARVVFQEPAEPFTTFEVISI